LGVWGYSDIFLQGGGLGAISDVISVLLY
jgi:hypothetical protein